MTDTRDIKRLLAAAWPGVAFDYGTAGRGRSEGFAVAWTGGPSREAVAATPGCLTTGRTHHTRSYVHYVRRDSPEEHAAAMAAWEAGRPAREAAAQEEIAARRAAHAAELAARRAALREAEACCSRLGVQFPSVRFTTYLDLPGCTIQWSEGPSVEEVKSRSGIDEGIRFIRNIPYESPIAKRRREHAESRLNRTDRRLARSKARAAAVKRGIARRIAGIACDWRPDLHPPGQEWLIDPASLPVTRRASGGMMAP